jgi:hypothetical protein
MALTKFVGREFARLKAEIMVTNRDEMQLFQTNFTVIST